MSRREGRDGASKRLHSSRSERSPSPKKSRREGKPATERTHSGNHNMESGYRIDREPKQRRRLQDALPLEDPPAPKTNVQPDIINEKPEGKVDGLPDGTKNSSDPAELPRSRSYFQHDDRGSAGHGNRSFSRREHGRWSDPKEQPRDKARNKVEKLDERTQSHANESNTWRHDRFYELESEAPLVRKRPAFREKKIPVETESVPAVVGSETVRVSQIERPMLGAAKGEERGHYSRGLDKPERPSYKSEERNSKRGDGPIRRGEMPRSSYQSRERYHGWGRDRFNGRYGERNARRQGGSPVEKWTHDLFDEANNSPTTKNEEEQIAKVEALLAS